MTSKLYFFAEGNSTIGRGHISRCLAIASMIDDLVSIHFVCLESNKLFVSQFVELYNIISIKSYDDIDSVVSNKDLVWIDNYDIDMTIKSRFSELAKVVIETNDIPYENNEVDIIVNHTPGIGSTSLFEGSSTMLHLGLKYSLLRPSFLEYARQDSTPNVGEGIFVCFGGADTYNLGYNYVTELLKSEFQNSIYWVRGGTNRKEVNDERLNILERLSEVKMIHYMMNAKILLIPSSVLSIEAIALRKPFFTTNFVANQDLIFKGLLSLNLASGLDCINTIEQVKDSIPAIVEYYNNAELHAIQRKNQILNLDGQSKLRIRDLILNSAKRGLN